MCKIFRYFVCKIFRYFVCNYVIMSLSSPPSPPPPPPPPRRKKKSKKLGAYCFRVVCQLMCPSICHTYHFLRTMYARILQFISRSLTFDFVLIPVVCLFGVMPPWGKIMKSYQQDISKKILARQLKLCQLVKNDK